MAYTTIDKSTLYFNTKTYTGTGSSNALTGVGFQPDWTWIKNRDQADGHHIYDVVRGVTKRIRSDSTAAEATTAQGLTAFGTDGFTVGTEEDVNTNGENFISWNWRAGNSAGSSNSDGSITSTVSANTTAGFSIVKYTGTGSNATIGHGLGAAPNLVIIKNYSRAGENWRVGSITGTVTGTGASNFGASAQLDNTGGLSAGSTMFNDTAPTSTVFSVGTAGSTNYSGDNLIAYCFAEKVGYSRFGVYTGNSDANGPFVFTGFKPAFLMIKEYGASGESWIMLDTGRSASNVTDEVLFANANQQEEANQASKGIDFLSNGFKIRSTDAVLNDASSGYFYMAFAEAPLVGSNNTPATAR